MSSISGIEIVFAIISIVTAISLHEMMHAVAGYFLGDDTAKSQGRISFNPLVHVDMFTTILLPLILLIAGAPPIGAAKPVPFNPTRLKFDEYGAALLALAGPATNFLLAVVGATSYKIAFNYGWELAASGFAIFTVVNIGFFVFNMLPVPPLDGSRVLYAFAPDSVRRLMDNLERMGILIIMFVFVFAYPLVRPLLVWANRALLNLIV
ncbi:site-2 protease family protein [Candidatus Saccharibacteria bacterium]|nr:site-2 protease family protein [Candidatus Saccharibacteria bacterium]MCB9821262.1 site-2 protease family protein [Candidatus Nomurabacteria bacterium]